MEVIDILKEAVKSKSWAMVRLAIKEIEGRPIPTPRPPTLQSTPTKNATNLFNDDGNNASIIQSTRDKHGNIIQQEVVTLGSFEEDKKFNSGKITPKNRKEYQSKYLTCAKCNSKKEVDAATYQYYKSAQTDYICTDCL